MPHRLQPHPLAAAPDLRIKVGARRTGDAGLELRYRVEGAVDRVLMPPPAPPERCDGLWRHSCFEAFLRAPADAGYFELNFSPSGQWAAYRFSDYRQGMAPALEVPPPRMEMHGAPDHYELAAVVDLEAAVGLLAALPWQLGLAAIVEEVDGRTSHWALAHPPGEPDFHHEDCFALELPPPERG